MLTYYGRTDSMLTDGHSGAQKQLRPVLPDVYAVNMCIIMGGIFLVAGLPRALAAGSLTDLYQCCKVNYLQTKPTSGNSSGRGVVYLHQIKFLDNFINEIGKIVIFFGWERGTYIRWYLKAT